MNASQVDNAISNASRLMNGGFMDLVENKVAKKNGKIGGQHSSDLKYLEEQAFGSGNNTMQMQNFQPQVNPTQRQFTNTTLQESFSKMPPMSGFNFPGADNINASCGNYQPGSSLLKEQQIQQQFVQQPQTVYQPQYIPQQVSGIDYGMIKALVSEAIRENLNEIKQSLLSEGSLRGINMPGGNKIQFLDSKGNLYEGQLNLKKKKK